MRSRYRRAKKLAKSLKGPDYENPCAAAVRKVVIDQATLGYEERQRQTMLERDRLFREKRRARFSRGKESKRRGRWSGATSAIPRT